MKIYQLSQDLKFALIDVTSKSIEDPLELSSKRPDLFSKFNYSWITAESTVIPDLSLIFYDILCCNEKGTIALNSILNVYNKYPCKIGSEPYNAICNIPLLNSVLNIKASKVKYFSTGDIMEISRAVFTPNEYPSLFMVEEMPQSLFCNEDLKKAVEEKKLSGLLFTECPIKSKSRFNIFKK